MPEPVAEMLFSLSMKNAVIAVWTNETATPTWSCVNLFILAQTDKQRILRTAWLSPQRVTRATAYRKYLEYAALIMTFMRVTETNII